MSRAETSIGRHFVNVTRVGVAAAAIFAGTAFESQQKVSGQANCIPAIGRFNPVPGTADSVGPTFDNPVPRERLGLAEAVNAYAKFKETFNGIIDFSQNKEYWNRFDTATPAQLAEMIQTDSFDYFRQWEFKAGQEPHSLPEVIVQVNGGPLGLDTLHMLIARGGNGEIEPNVACVGDKLGGRVASLNRGEQPEDVDRIDKNPFKENTYAFKPEWKPTVWSGEVVGKERTLYDNRGRQISAMILKSGEVSYVVTIPSIRQRNLPYRP